MSEKPGINCDNRTPEEVIAHWANANPATASILANIGFVACAALVVAAAIELGIVDSVTDDSFTVN